MKSIYTYLFIICLLSACNRKVDLISDPQTAISCSVEQTNSQNDFVSEVEQFVYAGTTEHWSTYPSGELSRVERKSTYNLVLQNGLELDFIFTFSNSSTLNYELNNEDFILEEEIIVEGSIFGIGGAKWNYKSFDQEFEEFYQNGEHLSIHFGGFDILTNINVNLEALNLQRVMVNGEEKIYADFNFEFEAFGAYDINKESGGYLVTNGRFKGIIN